MGYVPGNLFEVTNRAGKCAGGSAIRVVLYGHFCALGNASGAVAGFIVSTAVAIAIALFRVMGISMMWIVPSSMIIGILTGTLVSLVFRRKSEQ